jgi:hypothetical protein
VVKIAVLSPPRKQVSALVHELDSRFRGNDGWRSDFRELHGFGPPEKMEIIVVTPSVGDAMARSSKMIGVG